MKTTTKERPIMFKAEMVRTILEGRKTQARRPVKGDPCWDVAPLEFTSSPGCWAPNDAADYRLCPCGVPGDRLWVKETWRRPIDPDGEILNGFEYRADASETARDLGIRWKSAMMMPRIASRLTLEIVSVRVERVSEISEADARAEGYPSHVGVPGDRVVEPREWYMNAWDSLYAKTPNAWAANPWVWVVEFKRVES